ncbi:MAG TPA: hypothetical protein VK611_23945 [Acidimicrobiales bacterium]|nr:hypothetical protein [Acidimicrobiales bacterium]
MARTPAPPLVPPSIEVLEHSWRLHAQRCGCAPTERAPHGRRAPFVRFVLLLRCRCCGEPAPVALVEEGAP